MNNEKLQTLSQEEKQKIVDLVNTEVTSIAEQEKKTGLRVNIPNAEQLVANAGIALMDAKRQIANLLPGMSKKSIQRATLAYLDLPTAEIPVYLKTDEEKMLFAYGQRAIQARFIIVHHHANKLALEARLNKQKQSEGQKDGTATTEARVEEAK